ncbi:MAG: hypothetical protein KGY76_00875 [Candidatus Thermoplasmatota archaeon]|nr:hypothetical protein [Candidatus Thermoplasmatota archaeon]
MKEEITLKVKKSPVESGGRVRVNNSIIEDLDMEDGDLIVVSSKNKDVLVSAYSDEMIEEDNISIRVKDRKKLGVEEEDEVEVRKHEKLLNKLL